MTQLTDEHFELHDKNKAKMYEDKKKKKIEDDIWEIENQYPYLHFDRDRHKFNKADVNELNKLYSKLRKIKEKNKEDKLVKTWQDEIAMKKGEGK
jgi:hypothetical protein